jgi:hypothetical protein
VPVPLKVQLLLQTPPGGTLLQALPLAKSQLPPFAAAGGADSHDLTASIITKHVVCIESRVMSSWKKQAVAQCHSVKQKELVVRSACRAMHGAANAVILLLLAVAVLLGL